MDIAGGAAVDNARAGDDPAEFEPVFYDGEQCIVGVYLAGGYVHCETSLDQATQFSYDQLISVMTKMTRHKQTLHGARMLRFLLYFGGHNQYKIPNIGAIRGGRI